MLHILAPALLAMGAVMATWSSVRYRLPSRLFPLPVSWGLVAALWPAFVPAVRADEGDLAACLGATALCAVATAHASRTRSAQLPRNWWAEVQRELYRGLP